MNKSYRFILSALFLGALLLSACSGVAPRPGDDSQQNPGSGQTTEVVFTGSVQSMGGGEWTISGQTVGIDGSTSIDANIQVGDIVKVEAAVAADGKVLAIKIESSLPDDTGANVNDANSNDANANDDNSNGNANSNDDNSNGNANSNGNLNGDDNSNSAPSGPEQEILGAVQAMTNDTITIGGITYKLAQFTEFKTPIVVGDQVKIHVIVNADGTLTIREIEKTTGTGLTTHGNSNDDNGGGSNSNDDNGGGSNSNDDNGGGSNSNDDNGGGSNSNDDNGGGGNGNG